MDNKLFQVAKKLQQNIKFTIISDETAINKCTEVIQNEIYALKIIDNQKTINVDFTQSIESTFALHNSDGNAHSIIVSTINRNISDLNNEVSNKVDKIEGKTLSTNDLSDALKTNYDNAYTNSHNHNNKSLLDNLISTGNGNYYLSNDGTYKSVTVGTLINSIGSTSLNQTLAANQITKANFNGTPVVTLPTISENTKETKVILDFTTTNSSYPTINTTGIALKWSEKNKGRLPSFCSLSGVRNRIEFKTIDSGATWEAEYTYYGGIETNFPQPALSSNGNLGGASFAVFASSSNSSYPAFQASDNNPSTFWSADSGITSAYYTLWNPSAIKAASFDMTTYQAIYSPASITIYGSNDNSNWTSLSTYTNSNYTNYATWNIPIPSFNQGFFNYYKLSFNGTIGGAGYALALAQITINGIYIST